jgi:hypothetical protein
VLTCSFLSVPSVRQWYDGRYLRQVCCPILVLRRFLGIGFQQFHPFHPFQPSLQFNGAFEASKPWKLSKLLKALNGFLILIAYPSYVSPVGIIGPFFSLKGVLRNTLSFSTHTLVSLSIHCRVRLYQLRGYTTCRFASHSHVYLRASGLVHRLADWGLAKRAYCR